MNNQELIEYTAFLLHFQSFYSEGDIYTDAREVIKDARQKWKNECLPERNSEHCGSCVKQPSGCPRCMMDSFFGAAEAIVKGYNEG